MAKRVIWIDDDEGAMKAIVNNIFPKLWDKDISSEIYIMGSYAPSMLNYEHNESSIKNVNRAVYDTFIDYLINSKLIDNEESIRGKLPLLGLDNIEDNFLNEVRVASNKNDLICQEAADPLSTARKTAEKIIAVMNAGNNEQNPNDTVIMLDLVLLEHDYEKLQKSYNDGEEVAEVLSMKLYKELRTLLNESSDRPLVMLYSTFVIPNDVINNWIKGYSRISGEHSDLVIYNRDGIPANKNSEKNLVEKIVSLGG